MTGQRREHGTRVCYVFGLEGSDRRNGCRCEPCTVANRVEVAKRSRAILYGQWQPFVDAEPVRQHVEALRAAGLGRRTIARRAGVSEGVIEQLLYGKAGRQRSARVRPETAKAILAVRADPAALAGGALVDATGTQRRLQALVALGWSRMQLAARLGMAVQNFRPMMAARQVTAGKARDVARLYDELWDKPPVARDHRSRISVARARNYAAAQGWVPPLAWDDDTIDDPEARPAGVRPAERKQARAQDLVEDATELIEQGYTRKLAAERLGVSRGALDVAFARVQQREERVGAA